MDGFTHYQRSPILIIPSQMEVALPHRTVDTTQKRILSKNTKETHYQMSPLLKPPSQIRKIFYAKTFEITLVNQTAFSKYMPYRKNFPDFCKHFPNFCKHFANFCKHFPDSMLPRYHGFSYSELQWDWMVSNVRCRAPCGAKKHCVTKRISKKVTQFTQYT